MQKTQRYNDVRFTAETVRTAYETFAQLIEENPSTYEGKHVTYAALTVSIGDETWVHDNVDEFWADFRRDHEQANIDFVLRPHSYSNDAKVEVYHDSYGARVIAQHPTRAGIERVMHVFDEAAPSSLRPRKETPAPVQVPRVFIGHGGSSGQWRLLKDDLVDKHKYEVIAYETGARAGHTIRDVLEDMLAESNFALLVMTAADAQADGELRARQNVVHEAGLFQGKLGFARAIILLEHGVESFSNIDGVQYIPFGKDNIREAVGDVLAVLKREFGPQ